MKKLFEKITNKEIERLYKRFPKLVVSCFFIFILFAIFYGSCLAIQAFTGKAPLQLIADDNNVVDAEYFKNSFIGSDIKNWEGYKNINIVNEKEKVFKPKITSNFSEGRNIFFPELVKPDFRADLRFTPKNDEKINLTLNYGYLYRFIIGNGDYNQVQLQYNSRYPEKNLGKGDWKDVGQKKWIKRNGGLQPDKQIEVSMASRAKYNSNKIIVDIVVIGFTRNKLERDEFDFSYEVETDKKSSDYSEMIGIGLLDSKEEGIETQLEEFKLHKL